MQSFFGQCQTPEGSTCASIGCFCPQHTALPQPLQHDVWRDCCPSSPCSFLLFHPSCPSLQKSRISLLQKRATLAMYLVKCATITQGPATKKMQKIEVRKFSKTQGQPYLTKCQRALPIMVKRSRSTVRTWWRLGEAREVVSSILAKAYNEQTAHYQWLKNGLPYNNNCKISKQ